MSGGFSGVGGYAVILTPEGASLYGGGNASFEALVTAATGKIDVKQTTQEILKILEQQYSEQLEIEKNIRAAYSNESIENIIKSLRGETSQIYGVPDILQDTAKKLPGWKKRMKLNQKNIATIRKQSQHFYQVYDTLVDGLVALSNQIANTDEKTMRINPGTVETLIARWEKSADELEKEAAVMAQSLQKLDDIELLEEINGTFDRIREAVNSNGLAYSYDPTSQTAQLQNPKLDEAIQALLDYQVQIRTAIDGKNQEERKQLLALWNNVKFMNWGKNTKTSKLGKALGKIGNDETDPISKLDTLRQNIFKAAKEQLESNKGRKITSKEEQKLRTSITQIQTKAINELSEQTEDYAVRQLISLVFEDQTQIGPLKGLLAEQFKSAAAKTYIQDINNSVQQAYQREIKAKWPEIIQNVALTGKDTRSIKILDPLNKDTLSQIVESDDNLRIGTDINRFNPTDKRKQGQERLNRLNTRVSKRLKFKNDNHLNLSVSERELQELTNKHKEIDLNTYFEKNIVDLPSVLKQYDKVDSIQAATVGDNPYYIVFSEKQRATGGLTGSIGLVGDDVSIFNNMSVSGTNLYSSLDLISQNGADNSIPTAQLMFAMLNQSTASIYHGNDAGAQEKIKNYIKMQLAAKVLDLAFNRVNFFFNQQQKGIDMNNKNTLFVMNVNNLYIPASTVFRGLIEKFKHYNDLIADIVYVNVQFDTTHQAYPLWMSSIISQGGGDVNQAARWGFVANQVAANTKLNVSLSIANLMQLFEF